MKLLARLMNWSLRAKITTLLVAASLLPLGIVVIAKMSLERTVFASIAILIALVGGLLFAGVILKPIVSLLKATESVASGNLTTRIPRGHSDELGQIGRSFNSMAERIEISAMALEKARFELEVRVRDRAAELALTRESTQASEARLAGIVNSAMDAIISVDSEQRIVVFNAAAEKMFRCSAEAAIGEPIERFIPQRFRDQHAHHVAGFGRTGVTSRSIHSRGTLTGLRSDGEEFPSEASISQIEVAGQRIFTVILRDITERKRVEDDLRKSEAQLQTIVESLAEGVAVSDLDGQVLHFNRAALDLHGFASLDECRRHLSGFADTFELSDLTGTIWPVDEWPLARILRGESLRNLEVRIRRPQSDWGRVFSYGGTLVRDVRGQPMMAIVTIRDITERIQGEDNLRRLQEGLERRVAERTSELVAVNKELEAFSYSVSHDLRAPLRHINGFSLALLEDYADKLDDVGKTYLRQVRGASQEMAQLIDEVLQLARVTRGEMRRETVNLSEMAHEVILELAKEEPARVVTINIEEGLLADGDKRLLRILLVNLLGNAWKFTSKQEHAKVAFRREQKVGKAVYFVRDNGAGFDMAYVNRLFGAFQRLHTAAEFEGTGVGLATVQRIVYRHGGSVWADGAVNGGATFSFTLPDFNGMRDGEQEILPGGRQRADTHSNY